MILGRNIKLKIVSGIISTVYYIVPVIQDMIFKYPEDKFNDHIIFTFSLTLYQSVKAVASGTILPMSIQILVLLFTWWVLYLVLKFLFLNKKNSAQNIPEENRS